MIARDEEELIGRCLASIRPVADEIIVVDTGSEDRTKEIALDAGAKLIDFPWIDDFSAARNAGLEQARGEWILFLDADEELVADDLPAIKKLLLEKQEQAFFLNIVNLVGQDEATAGRSEFPSIRLFRNIPEHRFQGRIHEQLASQSEPLTARKAPVRIIHRGYLDTVFGKRQKIKRNDRLLQAPPGGHDAEYEQFIQAQQHLAAGRYEKAIAIFVPLYGPIDNRQKSAVAHSVIRCFQALGALDQALEWAGRGLEDFPDFTDLEYLRGVTLLELDRHQEAVVSFVAVLAQGDAPAEYHRRVGIGTGAAWEGLAFSYLGLRRYDIAAAAFRRVLGADPKNATAVFQLGSILLGAGHLWTAVEAELSSLCDTSEPPVQAEFQKLASASNSETGR